MEKKIGRPPDCCQRGMLSFLILWLLSHKEMYGNELTMEIFARRGERPNPGTLYPALKELQNKRLIASKREGRKVRYSLTNRGIKAASDSVVYFKQVYGEILEE